LLEYNDGVGTHARRWGLCRQGRFPRRPVTGRCHPAPAGSRRGSPLHPDGAAGPVRAMGAWKLQTHAAIPVRVSGEVVPSQALWILPSLPSRADTIRVRAPEKTTGVPGQNMGSDIHVM